MSDHNIDILKRRPIFARIILYAGWLFYGLVNIPMITTRGYPPLDPLLRALPWLWISPVLLSAVFDNDWKRRKNDVMSYSLLTTFVLSCILGATLVPRDLTLISVFIAYVFYFPFICLFNLATEYVFQKLLGRFRSFENGENANIDDHKQYGVPKRTISLMLAIIFLTIAFPFFYRFIVD